MFKNHPKGLIGAALANMGERFGFYIMMGVLLLFLQSKFGLSGAKASVVYSIFYASVYLLALVGGIIADSLKNYKGTIFVGLLVMTSGYVLLGVPGGTDTTWLWITYGALALISFGNGLFKGNLQALVGRMYDNDTYRPMRDSGFSLFYMFINVGAIFAPLFAVGIRGWWLQSNGVSYHANLPELAHAIIGGNPTAEQLTRFEELAAEVSGGPVADNLAFAQQYLDIFNTGYHYAFAAAVVAMLISVVIFLINRSTFPADQKEMVAKASAQTGATKAEVTMAASEIRQRILALSAVFGVVIFFWMSFHQNGVALTQFAKDYIDLSTVSLDLDFTKLEGVEIFQAINPFFVVFLTPLVIWLFGFLNKRNLEPSTPKKIVLGMFIATLAFVVMSVASTSMPPASELVDMGGLDAALKLSPWLMVITYLILTIAELFISPMGISFVSKVAPPHLQGIMQGLWLCATAAGNSLLFVGMILYNNLPIWAVWVCFAGACAFSMLTMLVMVKWLERVSK